MPKYPETKPKEKIDEGAYEAMPLRVEGPFDSSYTDAKNVTKVTPKLVFYYEIDGKEIPQYLTNSITTGGKTPSNLTKTLEKFKYFDECIKRKEEFANDEAFIAFLTAKFEVEKLKVQVTVKNSNAGTPEEYSTVKEVLKVL